MGLIVIGMIISRGADRSGLVTDKGRPSHSTSSREVAINARRNEDRSDPVSDAERTSGIASREEVASDAGDGQLREDTPTEQVGAKTNKNNGVIDAGEKRSRGMNVYYRSGYERVLEIANDKIRLWKQSPASYKPYMIEMIQKMWAEQEEATEKFRNERGEGDFMTQDCIGRCDAWREVCTKNGIPHSVP